MKAVIFDMDGVIIDSEPIHNRLMLATLRHFGIPFDEKEFIHYVGTTNAFLFEKLKREHPVSASVEEMDIYQYHALLETIPKEEIEPIPGIVDLLKSLQERKILTAIASSSSLELIKAVTQKFAIQPYFNNLMSGEDLPKSKPDPAIYLLSAKKLGVNPADCLVIEDARLGVEAAKAAGMTCIGFQNPSSGNQDLSRADYIVHTISEINLQQFF